jgi:hypothetical protein
MLLNSFTLPESGKRRKPAPNKGNWHSACSLGRRVPSAQLEPIARGTAEGLVDELRCRTDAERIPGWNTI